MGESGDDVVELAGKVVVVGIILLFFVVIFFICLHLYFKWFYLHRQQTTRRRSSSNRRRRRLDFAAGHQEITVTNPTSRIGLEPSILKSIPVIAFDPNEFKDGLECAVCLCEVCEGEKARILPKCSHGFHVECIDMWFQSHATCPLCRNSVSNQKPSDSKPTLHDQDRASSDGPNLPTNVLFWGDDTRVNALGPCADEEDLASPTTQPSTSATTSASDGMVVIDVLEQQ